MHHDQETEQETAERPGTTESSKLNSITDDGRKLRNEIPDAGVNAADNTRPKRRPAEAIIESRRRIAAGEKITAVMREVVAEFPDNALGIAVAIAPPHAYGASKKLKTATDYAMHLLWQVKKADEQRLKKRLTEKANRERLKALVQSGDKEAIETYERNKRTHAEAMRRRKARMKQLNQPESHDGA